MQATAAGKDESHWSLDFLVSDNDKVDGEQLPILINLHTADIEERRLGFFSRAKQANDERRGGITILRLLFPKVSGHPARSDFIEYRLSGCEYVHTVLSFMQPLAPVAAMSISQSQGVSDALSFLALLRHSIGGIIAQPPDLEDRNLVTLTRNLDEALRFRLSVPWLGGNAPSRRRVFWVQGRTNIESSIQFYQAAHALGLTIVVLDVPGHWMEDPDGPYAHYREAFIPFNIDGDEGLPQRIVDAVRNYPHPVDAIVSISDVRLPHVAKACEILGLPTESSEAYRIAGDKGETRKLEMGAGEGESFVLNTPQELDAVLERRNGVLDFPLVVKPCTGWNSDCVVKVGSEEELRAAIRRASDRHKDSAAKNTGVVVEPYIDGPEVDADFVILNGEVLFNNITDDFPCSGDLIDGTMSANFMETMMDIPTALPDDEKAILRNSLTQSIKKCGFTSGVFHCEARVRGSRAYYKPREDNGILDLHIHEGSETKKSPSCYLHEINARSPGYANCVVSLLLHGVDYYAVRLLLSVGIERELDRIKALSQPFLGGKPQYTSGIAVLPPSRLGVMGAEDAILEFLTANPELKKHVPYHQTVKERGDVIQGPDASELWMIGFVIVVSRKGRKEWLELAQQIRDRFDYRLLDE